MASALTATVWAYDLRLKHTPAAPAAMAAARALDLVLGATATMSGPGAGPRRKKAAGAAPSVRREAVPTSPVGHPPAHLPVAERAEPKSLTPRQHPGVRPSATPGTALRVGAPAVALAAHTYAVTAVSRHEAYGGSALTPLAALGATTTLGLVLARARPTAGPLVALTAAAYVRTAALPCLHAALNPSAPLTQRAVGGGIRAMIPLQAALAARSGASLTLWPCWDSDPWPARSHGT